MEEVNYARLKANTGIDFEQLREKYQNISKVQHEIYRTNERNGDENEEKRREDLAESERRREENVNAMKKLDGYKICKVCQGQGTIREVYNHFNIEKTCPECDGESVLSVDLKTLLEP